MSNCHFTLLMLPCSPLLLSTTVGVEQVVPLKGYLTILKVSYSIFWYEKRNIRLQSV